MITRKNLIELIDHLKSDIADDYRSTCQELDDDTPTMDVTIACNDALEYSWQTGDNSFTGGAYHFPHWAVVYLTRDSDTKATVSDVIDQLDELLADGVTIG